MRKGSMRRDLIVGVLVAAGAVGVVLWVGGRIAEKHRTPERRAWKAEAIQAIAKDLADPDFVQGQLERDPADRGLLVASGEEWMTSSVIVCMDGSWVVYRQQCHKADPKVWDIFIGKASDEKWYYSDYHFCVGAMVLESNGQPESLEQFRKEYFLVEFDGVSDEALEPTWRMR